MTPAEFHEKGGEIKDIWKDAPCGRILERQWWLNGVKVRQDIEVHVAPGLFTLYDANQFQQEQVKLIGTKEVA